MAYGRGPLNAEAAQEYLASRPGTADDYVPMDDVDPNFVRTAGGRSISATDRKLYEAKSNLLAAVNRQAQGTRGEELLYEFAANLREARSLVNRNPLGEIGGSLSVDLITNTVTPLQAVLDPENVRLIAQASTLAGGVTGAFGGRQNGDIGAALRQLSAPMGQLGLGDVAPDPVVLNAVPSYVVNSLNTLMSDKSLGSMKFLLANVTDDHLEQLIGYTRDAVKQGGVSVYRDELSAALSMMGVRSNMNGIKNLTEGLTSLGALATEIGGKLSGLVRFLGNNANENWGIGPLRASARTPLANENVPIDASHGLQSRTSGLFDNVIQGRHGSADAKYLYTVDQRGVNIVLEQTPFPTPRGMVVHSNISSKAAIGGEVWFGPDKSVTINAGSGRFGDGAGISKQQWDATINLWKSLGYNVNAIPYGKR